MWSCHGQPGVCQFAFAHFDSTNKTTPHLSEKHQHCCSVESPEIVLNLYHQLKSIPHSRQHNLENTPYPTEGSWLQCKQDSEHPSPNLSPPPTFPSLLSSQQILSPPHPPAPCHLLSAFVPNHLHKRLMGSNSREVVLLKT